MSRPPARDLLGALERHLQEPLANAAPLLAIQAPLHRRGGDIGKQVAAVQPLRSRSSSGCAPPACKEADRSDPIIAASRQTV